MYESDGIIKYLSEKYGWFLCLCLILIVFRDPFVVIAIASFFVIIISI